MRFLEIFILLTSVPGLIFALMPPANRPKALVMNGLVLLPLALALAQILTGQAHWQMLPAYVVILLLVLWRLPYLLNPQRETGRRSLWVAAAALLGLLALAISGLLTTLVPVFTLPNTVGPYLVGTQSHYVPREDAEFPGYMLQIWYPIEGDIPNHATYFDDARRAEAFGRQFGLPFLFSHANLVETNGHPDAPINAVDGPYPVIMLSHQPHRSRVSHSLLAEALASFGYIVVAPDHPLDALDMVYPDGTVLPWGALWPSDEAVSPMPPGKSETYAARLDDLQFVWSQLPALIDEGLLAGQWDLSRVGVLGGTAALSFCGQLDPCQAAVVLDDNPVTPGEDLPWWGSDIESVGTVPAVLMLYQESVLPSHMLDRIPEIVDRYAAPDEAPSFAQQYFGQPIALYRYLAAHSERNLWLRMGGMNHSYFSDETLWAPLLMPRLEPSNVNLMPADRGRGLVRDFTLLFLNTVLQESQDAALIQQGIDLLPEVDSLSEEDIAALEAALDDYTEANA